MNLVHVFLIPGYGISLKKYTYWDVLVEFVTSMPNDSVTYERGKGRPNTYQYANVFNRCNRLAEG